MVTTRKTLWLFLLLLGPFCSQLSAPEEANMDEVATAYVRLVLALGQHDPDYVDAYYGPADWKTEAESSQRSLEFIDQEASRLIDLLGEQPPDSTAEMLLLRHQYLSKQLGSLAARVSMLQGQRFSFDDEARALYDALPPTLGEEHFQKILDDLETLVPGRGLLIERYTAFTRDFVIPYDKLDAVFSAAIQEARRRTRAQIDLPEHENFVVEYVTDKSWSGYNWYQGKAQSLIQVNTDLPIYIDRAIDLASHEGYPGHHVYNVLLEQHLVEEQGWLEFSVYPLFSPQSLIAEGSANYGIEVAFPAEERLEFETEVLFPLAGLDPQRAERYYQIQDLVGRLSYAGNEAARRYLNQEITAQEAAHWLETYAMMPPDRATQRVRFFDQYRSYVINYNLGQDMVRNFVVSRSDGDPTAHWREYKHLLASPRLPSGLVDLSGQR